MDLFKYFKKQKFQFSIVVILIIINAGFSTLAGISSANALSSVAKLNAQKFFFWALIMGLSYLMYAIFGYLVTVNQSILTQNIDILIRKDVALRLSNTNYKYFHKHTTSTYSSWLTNDINTINEYGVGDLMMIIQQVSEIVMGAITLAYFQISLLITVILLTIIMAVVPNLFTKLMSSRSLLMTKSNERLVNKINDVLNGFNTLFLANQTRVVVQKITEGSQDVKENTVRYSKAAGLTQAVTNGIAFISQVIVLTQTGWLILRGLTPVGTVSGAQYFAGTIFAELSGISFNWQEFKSLKPVMSKLASIKTISDSKSKVSLSNKENTISLNKVSFKYANHDKQILNNIDLTLQSGKKYILVGDSASGKTTLLNIISGLIKEYTGKIFIAEQDYTNVSDQQLHEQISYIQQDPYIFANTLKWNLTLGKNYPQTQVDKVVKECGLNEIIDKLPDGINTTLNDTGSDLSGGQKQRIAFARELLRNKPIFILDEATSALDKKASMELERLILTKPNTTVIMVTHHLQDKSRYLADKVIKIEDLKMQ